MSGNAETNGYQLGRIFERSEVLRNRYHFKCKKTRLTYCTCLEGGRHFYFLGDGQLKSMYNDVLQEQSTSIPALLKLLSEGSTIGDNLRIKVLKSVEETVFREREEFNKEYEEKQRERRQIKRRLEELRKERVLNRYKLTSLVDGNTSNSCNETGCDTEGKRQEEIGDELKCQAPECLCADSNKSKEEDSQVGEADASTRTRVRARGRPRIYGNVEESEEKENKENAHTREKERDATCVRFFECTDCKRTYHPACCNLETSMRVKHSFPWSCPECSSCTVCGENNRKNLRATCNICGRFFHISCLSPRLPKVPKGLWLCNDCSVCSRCHKIVDFHVSDGKICLEDIPDGFEFIDTKFGTRICLSCDNIMNDNYNYEDVKGIVENEDLNCNVCNEILDDRGNRTCSICRFAVHSYCFHKQICKLCEKQKS